MCLQYIHSPLASASNDGVSNQDGLRKNPDIRTIRGCLELPGGHEVDFKSQSGCMDPDVHEWKGDDHTQTSVLSMWLEEGELFHHS